MMQSPLSKLHAKDKILEIILQISNHHAVSLTIQFVFA